MNADNVLPVTAEAPVYKREKGWIGWLFLFGGYLFSRWVGDVDSGFSHTLFYLLFSLLSLCYLKKEGIRLTKSAKVCYGLLTLLSLSFLVCPAEPIVNVVEAFLLLAYPLLILCSCQNAVFPPEENLIGFDVLKSALVIPIANAGKLFTQCGEKEKKGSSWKVMLGLLLSIVPSFAVLLLLLSADGAFANVFDRIDKTLTSDTLMTNIGYLILAVPAAMYLFGVLYGNTNGACRKSLTADSAKRFCDAMRFLPAETAVGIAFPILLLYVLFFLSQLSYFTSAFSWILPEQVTTYAEYARRGFFELCAISAINLVALVSLYAFTKADTKGKRTALKICHVLFAVFTLGFIAIALSKMGMYIGQYGLTRLRVYTSLFMIFLGILFLLVLLKAVLPRLRVVLLSVLTAFVLISGTAFADADRIIADHNVDLYVNGVTKTVDVHLFYDLSESALPAVLPLLDDEDAIIRREAQTYVTNLYNKMERMTLREETLASLRARKLLEELGYYDEKIPEQEVLLGHKEQASYE